MGTQSLGFNKERNTTTRTILARVKDRPFRNRKRAQANLLAYAR